MTLSTLSELTLEQQELLRKTVNEYYVNVDPTTNQRYVRFMGENVSLNSILNSQVLLG
jgi:hypothetical protein